RLIHWNLRTRRHELSPGRTARTRSHSRALLPSQRSFVMRYRGFLVALVVGLGVGVAGVPGGTGTADDDTARIGKLVKDLGSKKSTIRDRAKRELDALGIKALEALRQAARSADLETSRRASTLLKKLEEKKALDDLLAPKKVRLKL